MFEAIRLLIDGIMGGSHVHRRTIRELEKLSDKQLADIGIARYDIPRAVLEGKR
jgi:hypothetical protein